jgi:hypothetical protein
MRLDQRPGYAAVIRYLSCPSSREVVSLAHQHGRPDCPQLGNFLFGRAESRVMSQLTQNETRRPTFKVVILPSS